MKLAYDRPFWIITIYILPVLCWWEDRGDEGDTSKDDINEYDSKEEDIEKFHRVSGHHTTSGPLSDHGPTH